MNASSKTSNSPGESRPDKPGFGKKRIGSVAVALLLAVYAFLQPHLNERYGLNLPGLGKRDASTSVAQQSTPQSDKPILESTASGRDDAGGGLTTAKDAPEERTKTTGTQTSDSPRAGAATADSGPPANSPPTAEKSSKTAGTKKTTAEEEEEDSDLLFGILREVRHDRFLSPQGIQYNPGSAEGHRLEHLRRHIKDQPKRAGKHGVFDGGMEGALATIDRAYERAKKKIKTTKRVDGKRTIYTVDMGGRVGFVGGRDGGRQRNPMARRVRIVLEGTQFITAFPL